MRAELQIRIAVEGAEGCDADCRVENEEGKTEIAPKLVCPKPLQSDWQASNDTPSRGLGLRV